MLTNNVDLQNGGEANFTSSMKGHSSLCHIWQIFKIDYQIIIIEEKTQFELNLTSFKLILACGDLSATTWLGWENMTKI